MSAIPTALNTQRAKFISLVKRKIKRLLGRPINSANPEALEVFIPKFEMFSRDGTFSETTFGWHGIGKELIHKNLIKTDSVITRFKAPVAGILGVHLTIGTHGRVNDCTVRIELYRENEKNSDPLTWVERNAKDFIDNSIHYFEFEKKLPNDSGPFLMKIFSPDATLTNCVAIWGTSGNATTQVDFVGHSHIVTRYEAAPREEMFFPRYTASCFNSDVCEDFFGWQGLSYKTRILPIYPGSSAEIVFLCPEDNLSKFTLVFATFGRQNICHYDLKLFKLNNGNWIQETETSFNASAIHDHGVYEFVFNKVTSVNSWFKLTISSTNASPNNCLGIVGTVCQLSTDSFIKLTRKNDLVSMIDTKKNHLNLKPLYQKRIPEWNYLCQSISKDQFQFCIIADTDESRAIRSKYSLANLDSMQIIQPDRISKHVKNLEKCHLIVFANQPLTSEVEFLLEITRRKCILTCSIDFSENAASLPTHDFNDDEQSNTRPKCRYVGKFCDFHLNGNIPAAPCHDDFYEIYTQLFPQYKKLRLPSFSIISILYHKQAEIIPVLESIARQDYPGEIEIILIDDHSPDKSVELVEEIIRKRPETFGPNGRMPVKIIRNSANLGNCASRNRAIDSATNDILLIIDADCVMNNRSLSAHAAAHGVGDVDVVIGTHNLETNGQDPIEVVERLALNPKDAIRLAQLQDGTVLQSFLNSVTRNVSIRRSFVKSPLFDELFSYSKDPSSGFGWEDVEMGYRLYLEGARFRFTDLSIAVHISHLATTDESSKPPRSMKNFRRLIEKHPDLKITARRWVLDTFEKICKWMDETRPGQQNNVDRKWLTHQLSKYSSLRKVYAPSRRYRVLSFRWHCPHQYELYKLPLDVTLLDLDGGEGFTRAWEYDQRPLPINTRWRRYPEIDQREFDFAILHFDENALFPENTNGVLSGDWGHNFTFLKEHLTIPMIAICHGTPQFKGQYDPKYTLPDKGEELGYEKQALVNYLAEIPVVCNSHQALADWGFKNARVIWHGFDPMEFGPGPLGHGIYTLGKMMKERPYYRGYDLCRAVYSRMPSEVKFFYLSVARPSFDYKTSSNEYAYAKFRLYAQALRQKSIYFNPTIRSPMPRTRGEAMMSGLATVSADNHDVSLFIKNGINGFYSNDPEELAEYLIFLYRNESACKRIGIESRRTAMDIFNVDRYHRDWLAFIKEVVG